MVGEGLQEHWRAIDKRFGKLLREMKGDPWIFDGCSSDVRAMFDRSSIDVRQMFEG